MSGILYLVAVPIGNYEDITFRAIKVLKEVNLVVCEERTEGQRLLRHYGIENQVETLNEHNEAAAAGSLHQFIERRKIYCIDFRRRDACVLRSRQNIGRKVYSPEY